MITSQNSKDAMIYRAAEALRGRERSERLGSVLAGLTRALAGARWQIRLLRRESVALRTQLEREGQVRSAAAGDGRVVQDPRVQCSAGIGGRHRG